jgi:DNA-directed RNA polymerase specialized sigma24 family protein
MDIQKGERARKRRIERRALSLDHVLDNDDPDSDTLDALIASADFRSNPEAALMDRQLQLAIEEARGRLGREVHKELLDRLLAGYTPTEIAHMTGDRRSTVDSRITRLLDLLRVELDDLDV